VVGTPAEEGGGGKIPMLEAGCFDDLAFAMMIHPGPADAPETARGSWYVRADTLAELDVAFARVRACFEAGALAAECDWELTETSPRYAEFSNDEQLARLFAANGAALGRDMDLAESGPRGMATASTDMGNVSRRVRAIHPYLGIGSLPAVNHQPAFAAATVTPAAGRAVRDGAVLLAQTAIDAVLGDLSALGRLVCPVCRVRRGAPVP
jgi:metal-dependent amidase/aminoacylase/carboxypeptidase family protein